MGRLGHRSWQAARPGPADLRRLCGQQSGMEGRRAGSPLAASCQSPEGVPAAWLSSPQSCSSVSLTLPQTGLCGSSRLDSWIGVQGSGGRTYPLNSLSQEPLLTRQLQPAERPRPQHEAGGTAGPLGLPPTHAGGQEHSRCWVTRARGPHRGPTARAGTSCFIKWSLPSCLSLQCRHACKHFSA